MKKIIEIYGTGIVAVMVAISLLALIYESLQLGKEMFAYVQKENWTKETGEAFDECADRILPRIDVKGDVKLYTLEPFEVSGLATGYDKAGIDLAVYAIGFWDESFLSISDALSTNGAIICVQKPGIYWMLLETSDGDGNCCRRVVKVYVNER